MKTIIISISLILCTLFSVAQDDKSKGSNENKVQEFELTDIDGNIISSKNTQGKVVVLNFWFIGCKPCLEEIPELNKVYEKYANNPDIVFASIALDDLKRVEKYLKKYNIKYPIVTDGKELSELFQIEGYPTNIVIDKDGNYNFRFAGGFSGIGNLISKSIEKVL